MFSIFCQKSFGDIGHDPRTHSFYQRIDDQIVIFCRLSNFSIYPRRPGATPETTPTPPHPARVYLVRSFFGTIICLTFSTQNFSGNQSQSPRSRAHSFCRGISGQIVFLESVYVFIFCPNLFGTLSPGPHPQSCCRNISGQIASFLKPYNFSISDFAWVVTVGRATQNFQLSVNIC